MATTGLKNKLLAVWLLVMVASAAFTATSAPPASALNADRMWFEGEFGGFSPGPVHIADGSLSVQVSNTAIQVFQTANPAVSRSVFFTPPEGQSFVPGTTYIDDGSPTGPGARLDVGINSCSTSIGRFTISELTMSNDVVTSLVATWQHTCGTDPTAPRSFGGVSFNGSATFHERRIGPGAVTFASRTFETRSAVQTVTITNDGPASLTPIGATITGRDATSFRVAADRCTGVPLAPGATCGIDVDVRPLTLGDLEADLAVTDPISTPAGGGQRIALRASASPASGRASLQGERGAGVAHASHIDITDVSAGSSGPQVVRFGGGQSYSFEFAAPMGQTLQVGEYTNAIDLNDTDATHPGMRIAGGGSACANLTGRFVVDQIAFGSNGAVTRFAARFEQRCIGFPEALSVGSTYGTITYNATVPHRDRAVEPAALVFRTSPGNTAAPQVVTISNHGVPTLSVSDLSIIGPQSAEYSILSQDCTGQVLGTSGTCSVTIGFTPGPTNARHLAALRIVDDSLPSTFEPFEVQLVGTTSPAQDGFVLGEADDGVVAGNFVGLTNIRAWLQSGEVAHIEADSAAGPWVIDLRPNSISMLGTFDSTQPNPPFFPPARASVVGPTTACAGPVSTRFTIDEFEFAQPFDGSLTRFSARWQLQCTATGGTTFGAITLGAESPYWERTVTPTSITFPTTERGASVVRSVTVTNTGTAPSVVHGVTLGGAGASDFVIQTDACTGTALVVGASCVVQVSYRPGATSPGSAAALLTITDDSRPDGGSGFDVVLAGSVPSPPAPPPPPPPPPPDPVADPSGEFTAITPARLLDTRNGMSGRSGPLDPDSAMTLQVTGRGGVPAEGVAAVVLNVTGTQPTAPTFVTVFPSGIERPVISNLNLLPGQTSPNMVTVGVGSDGAVSLYSAVGTTHLIADVVGYYSAVDGPAGSRFHALTPDRLVDTRLGRGAPAGPIGAGAELAVSLPSGATAAVLNVTVDAPTADGFVAVYPGGVARPSTSNVNFTAGQTAANLVTVRAGADGTVRVYNSHGSSQIIVDIVGVYDDVRIGDAGRFVAVAPERAFDSRDTAPLGPAHTAQLRLGGRYGIPSVGVAAVVGNLTATAPTSAGYLSAFSADGCVPPPTSNVGFRPSATVPNQAIVGVSGAPFPGSCAAGQGTVAVHNALGFTHVIFDVFGYFRA